MKWKSANEIVFNQKLLFLLYDNTGNYAVISGIAKKIEGYWDLIPDVPYDRSRWNCKQWEYFNNTLKEVLIEEPKLIGHLNTVIGYNGHEKNEIGTEVFEYKDKYFFIIKPLNGGLSNRCSFYKETLKPCIDFIN